MRHFCLQLEASCLQWSFFTYSDSWEHFWLQFELFKLHFELLCLQLSLFAYSGKVCLRSTSVHCKQRSSTVSKKPPTVTKKASPICFPGKGSICKNQRIPASFSLILRAPLPQSQPFPEPLVSKRNTVTNFPENSDELPGNSDHLPESSD